MTVYLLNALSLNMVDGDCSLYCQAIESHTAAMLLREVDVVVNAIGHADTAAVVASLLSQDGFDAPPAARLNVSLRVGDSAIVEQYSGPRLPEGASSLPEGASIRFWYVRIEM